MQSIHAVRYQSTQIRDAPVETRANVSDHVAKVEAQALAGEVGSYRFLICSVVVCGILTTVNQVNKLLQSTSMQLYVAVDLINKAKNSLVLYRKFGFAGAQTTAKECEDMNVEPHLKQKTDQEHKKAICL